MDPGSVLFSMPGPTRVLRRAHALVRDHGLRAGSREIAKKAATRVYASCEYVVLEKRLDARAESRSAVRARLDVREGSREEVLALTKRVTGDDATAESKALQRLSRSYRCLLGFLDGIPVSQFWWIDGEGLERRADALDLQTAFFEVDLHEGDAWCFKFELDPARRGGGLATEVLHLMENWFYGSGYRRLFGYVDSHNIPASWLYAISGWQSVRRIRSRYFLSLLGFSGGRLFVKAVPPREGTFPYRPAVRGRSSTAGRPRESQYRTF